ncbi:MAG: hypothetical protein PHQ74_06205 [Crocinitomicaceae bacterium]|nr:hypothetical protein [Crocinitomicaceae bacterium]
MNGLVAAHSGMRWIVLILILAAIFNAIASKASGKYEKKDKMLNLFAMIFLHIQLLVGIILYFNSGKVSFAEGWMKNASTRFYGMEHVLLMLIAITLVTIGRKKAEKASLAANKHGAIVKFYAIGLILIIISIPWPFRNLGGSWF